MESITTTEEVNITTTTTTPPIDWSAVELLYQAKHYEVPSMEWWLALAKCESNLNWKDRGRFAGGLGIMTHGSFRDKDMGTWERWGGEQFAPSPDKATWIEQIVVANRIAVVGWSTTVTRSAEDAESMGVPITYVWEKHGTGFDGWGCTASVGQPTLK